MKNNLPFLTWICKCRRKEWEFEKILKQSPKIHLNLFIFEDGYVSKWSTNAGRLINFFPQIKQVEVSIITRAGQNKY